MIGAGSVAAQTTVGPRIARADHEVRTGESSEALSGREYVRARAVLTAGEQFQFDVHLGRLRAGTAILTTDAGEGSADGSVYRVSMHIEGGPFFFKIDDRQTSWVAPDPFRTLRVEKHLEEGRKSQHSVVVMDHAAGTFHRFELDAEGRQIGAREGPPRRMPIGAMDELAFLYFVRGLDLREGETFEIPRYFDSSEGPMRLEVLGRKTLRTAAGSFETLVVRPTVPQSSIFSAEADPRLYLSDDAHRAIVRVTTRTEMGPLVLSLKNWTPGVR